MRHSPLARQMASPSSKDTTLVHFDNVKELIAKCDEIITDPGYRKEFGRLTEKYFSESVNVTDFLVWFVENYPESKLKIQKEPDYQFNFR